MADFIVELESGVWLAPWNGDPGRTLVQKTARLFGSRAAGERALEKARAFRPFPNARVESYVPERNAFTCAARGCEGCSACEPATPAPARPPSG